MSIYKEKPFELLRKSNGVFFSAQTIRNWYIARTYILKKLRETEKNNPFSPDSKKRLHVVLEGDDDRMLCVARQVALNAHYLNFDEECDDETSQKRTVITIVTHNKDLKKKLSEEEYLYNLPKYCKFVVENYVENKNSYIDIEIHIAPEFPEKGKDDIMLIFKKADVDMFFSNVLDGDEDVFSIDTRKAFYTSKMYQIGETIANLPAENIHDTKRYAMALNVYQYEKLIEKPKPLFDNIGEKQYRLKEILSNVFCSDTFESRANAIRHLCKGNLSNELAQWEKQNEALSKSEHARWVVEKLIMGYRPLNEIERNRDEILRAQFKSKIKLKKFHDGLKRNDDILAHIDLCSYRDLRRINPGDLKFDSFLMLAIPKILDKVGEND